MNTHETISQMRALKLMGMANAYQTVCELPVDKHPGSQQLLAQIVEAEILDRQHRKTRSAIQQAQFRYQATVEEIIIASERNLSKDVVYKLADTSFVKRHENIIITGATGCGKTGRPEPFYRHGLGLPSLPNGTVRRSDLGSSIFHYLNCCNGFTWPKRMDLISKSWPELKNIICSFWMTGVFNHWIPERDSPFYNSLKIDMAKLPPSSLLRCLWPIGMTILQNLLWRMLFWIEFYRTPIELILKAAP